MTIIENYKYVQILVRQVMVRGSSEALQSLLQTIREPPNTDFKVKLNNVWSDN